MKRSTRILILITVLLLVAVSLAWYAHLLRPTGVLTVAFLDVGQGDAVYIESPSGARVLYDAGPDGSVVRELRTQLPRWSRTLDLAILSHPDKDHVAGFSDILRRFKVGALLDSGYQGEVDNPFYGDILSWAKEHDIPVGEARAADHIDLGGGAYAEIFAPEGAYMVGDTNIASIVMKLTYGSTSLLLSGDLPFEHENILSERYGVLLDVDVFKAGHHGSKTSSGEKFLRAMTPELVVVSSGKNNSYGHPNKEVTERFTALGIPWLNTAASGTIILRSDGKVWSVRSEK